MAAGEAIDKVVTAVAPVIFVQAAVDERVEEDPWKNVSKEEGVATAESDGLLALKQLDIQLILAKGSFQSFLIPNWLLCFSPPPLVVFRNSP